MPQDSANVLSFLSLRKALGIIGVALPVVVIGGDVLFLSGLTSSLSQTYYTPMRDIFVGALCAVGVFQISYQGYAPKAGELISDRLISRIAGVAAFGIALLPTSDGISTAAATIAVAPPSATCLGSAMQCLIGGPYTSILHFVAGAAFFAAVARMNYYHFTRTDRVGAPSTKKRTRNRIYRGCGLVLVGAVVAMTLLFVANWFFGPAFVDATDRFSVLFGLESIAIWAFALGWLVKGDGIGWLND